MPEARQDISRRPSQSRKHIHDIMSMNTGKSEGMLHMPHQRKRAFLKEPLKHASITGPMDMRLPLRMLTSRMRQPAAFVPAPSIAITGEDIALEK